MRCLVAKAAFSSINSNLRYFLYKNLTLLYARKEKFRWEGNLWANFKIKIVWYKFLWNNSNVQIWLKFKMIWEITKFRAHPSRHRSNAQPCENDTFFANIPSSNGRPSIPPILKTPPGCCLTMGAPARGTVGPVSAKIIQNFRAWTWSPGISYR